MAAALWWSFFHATRLGALDPHHVEATPGALSVLAQSGMAFLALILLTAAKQNQSPLAPFLAMFVLAQVVAPAFTFPDRLRADEEPSKLARWAQGIKSSVGGALLMKVLSIVLAFTTGWLLGSWWFVILIAIGFILISSKGTTALLLVQADDGEYRNLSDEERQRKLSYWARIVVHGKFGYLVGGAGVAF